MTSYINENFRLKMKQEFKEKKLLCKELFKFYNLKTDKRTLLCPASGGETKLDVLTSFLMRYNIETLQKALQILNDAEFNKKFFDLQFFDDVNKQINRSYDTK